jgi:hypothetical protein
MAGRAEWVDPDMTHTRIKDTREHRYRYMRARAEIEDCIPEVVMIAMIDQGYDTFSFKDDLEDLCSLLHVVHEFMMKVRARFISQSGSDVFLGSAVRTEYGDVGFLKSVVIMERSVGLGQASSTGRRQGVASRKWGCIRQGNYTSCTLDPLLYLIHVVPQLKNTLVMGRFSSVLSRLIGHRLVADHASGRTS